MKKQIIISLILLSIIFNGCFVLRVAVNNIEESISSPTPQKVEKIKYPVLDSVRLAALWVGHSTVLVQIYDKVIITDPFLNNRIGGLFLRKREAGMDIGDLSKLDLILISHSHMDHLNYASLGMLEDKFPGCNLIFPSGDENYMPDFNLNLIMADTKKSESKEYVGDAIDIDGMKVTPVYALHQGGRYAIDTYTWLERGATGYIVQYKDVCLYFAGDTGYEKDAFKKIGSIFKIDLALIPIGPCRNCESKGMWFHTSSMEALQVFEDLKAENMIPIHFGTIKYFSDPDTPLFSMEKILANPDSRYHYLEDKVKVLKEGEQIVWNLDGKVNTEEGTGK
jgi:L-ascorbate metabolism protein UlaG (beta-lactamase superfamily)